MSDFLGVRKDIIEKAYRKMGFPETGTVDKEKAFPTIVRVNWDILREKEIRRLTGLSASGFRKQLQEMDMLDVKLGQQPPGLAVIRIRKEDFSMHSMNRLKNKVGRHAGRHRIWEQPFSFLSEMKDEEKPDLPAENFPARSFFKTCIMYSYTSSHGDFLLNGEDFYPGGILSRLKNRGVNAGWMPLLLRDIAPGRVFKEFGRGHEIRLRNLRLQVDKALQYGIRLYLYLNEPRYVPASFFERYPQARGRHAFQKGYYGMCTSDKDVRDWLSESMYFLFSRVPELGGVILITASEYETNCYSHIPTYDFQAEGLAVGDDRYFGLKHEDTMCPRCAERGPGQVLSDMANIADSARRDAGSKADVVQWLWGWDYIMPPVNVRKTIKKLPPDVKIMVDWQKRTQFNLFGRPGMVDEYTMAYTEPSDYAAEIVSTCRSLNRKLLAKCAIVTTAEMNALPYLPALDNVEKLVRKLRRCGVEGLLGCWVFGSYPARNMELLTVSIEDLSKKYYGRGYRHALSAWQSFSRGMKFFPTVQSVLYYSALSCAPGMKLNMKPEPWRSGMNLMPPEDMEKVSGTLGAEVMIRSFRKTAGYFSNGLKSLKTAIGMAPGKYSDENMRDYGISRACMIHLKSVANYSEFILLRNKLLAHPGDVNLRKSLVKILKDEEKNSRAMLVLMLKDSRIGYEGTTGYFYTAGEIVEKIEMIKEVLKEVRKHTQEATCI